jgi:hypothetical protein
MDKAYFVETALLVKHMAAAHFIQRIYRSYRAKIIKVKEQNKVLLKRIESDVMVLMIKYRQTITPVKERISRENF